MSPPPAFLRAATPPAFVMRSAPAAAGAPPIAIAVLLVSRLPDTVVGRPIVTAALVARSERVLPGVSSTAAKSKPTRISLTPALGTLTDRALAAALPSYFPNRILAV